MIEKIITGIVLGKREYEDEHIVRILTEGGNIVSLKAKGLHKNESKNRMSLQPLNIVEIEYFAAPSNSNRGRIKRASAIKEFITDTDLGYAVSQVILDLVDNISTHNNAIYNAVNNILDSITGNTYTFQKIWSLMILILRNEGYSPIVDRCVKCGSNQNIKAFSLYEGGLLCEKHEESIKYELPPSTLRKIIEINIQTNPMNCNNLLLEPEEAKVIKSMYKLFFENQLGINLFLMKNI